MWTHRHILVPLLGLISLSACSSAPSADENSADVVSTPNRLSPVGAAVHKALATTFGASEQGSTWGESFDNSLSDGWLVQVPLAQFWGASSVPTARECTANDDNCNLDYARLTCSSDADCAAT